MKQRCTVFLFLFGLGGACLAQQIGASAAVSGIVTDAVGEPLPGAVLSLEKYPLIGFAHSGPGLVPGPPPPAYSASSDALGRFEFPDAAPAEYFLSVKLDGYLPQSYRGEFQGDPGARIALDASHKLSGVAFKLVREAVIAGRILDTNGTPLQGLSVGASRRTFSQGGTTYLTGRRVTTAGDGTFRIDGLSPGTYYLSAMSLGRSTEQGRDAYAATYYPAALEPSGAEAIRVAAGETIHAADMRLQKTRLFRIRGDMVDATTGAAPLGDRPMVSISPMDPDRGFGVMSMGGRVEPGSFDFGFFAPGVYIVSVRPSTGRDGWPSPNLAGRQTVTVTNADVSVTLRLAPAVEITGHVSPAAPGLMVRLSSTDGITFPGLGNLQADGAFTIAGLEREKFRVEVSNQPEGSYVKSIRFGDREVTGASLDLTSGATGLLDITLSPNAADIIGMVRDSKGAALAGATVTLWTLGLPKNGAADFSRTTTTGVDGEFKFTSLPPGEYRAAAWEEIERGLGVVPEFRAKFEGRATAVKLNEKDHARIELRPIPRDAIEAEASKLR